MNKSTAAIKAAAEGPLKGILEYATDPLVSSDMIGNPHSSIFVPEQTLTIGGNFIKVVSWYDNEWGYSNRTAELIDWLSGLRSRSLHTAALDRQAKLSVPGHGRNRRSATST